MIASVLKTDVITTVRENPDLKKDNNKNQYGFMCILFSLLSFSGDCFIPINTIS